ncbi:hypothetical protein CCR75_001581 [Bremia lactucae]|uniref:Peroxisomal membrane protein PEX16 n=1 Tax=Bremia lactucae TaxID=4779 RepID=A0A976FH12_BRELC|nr:hypothetical protein CCR75_001581 [Bremia lactucae]
MADDTKTTIVETNVAFDGDSTEITRTMNTTTPFNFPFTKPASLLAAYEAWVGTHANLARNVETSLYVAPQLVPKQVMEPEMAAQFGYSMVGLLHLYHDYILWKKGNQDTDPPTNWLTFYRLVRVPLSFISHTQVLAEVVARRVSGDVGKWRFILWFEVLKAVLRLVLMTQHRQAMLLRGGKYQGVESMPQPSVFTRFQKVKQPGARTGKIFGKLMSKVPEPLEEKSAEDTIQLVFEDAIEVVEDSRENFLVAGELCHILRPVVYAVLRRRRAPTSWTPVLVSMFIELSGLALSVSAVKPVKSINIDKARNELATRKMVLFLYLLRDPVFATVTKPAVEKASDIIDHVPGLGKLFRFGTTTILNYYHELYFYTSAS